MTWTSRLAIAAIGLLALARPVAAQAPGPESPPPPWFAIADIPSQDPKIANTRWLWNREARTLRYCRQDAVGKTFTCADATLPAGEWVLRKLEDAPEPGVASATQFFSPDLGQTLECRATSDGALSCG